ncbi:MAG TPA: iron ABC transporter permease [Gemmatimonadales bacterium]|nr:iron ABC transporter permease [Gemmatimonadales bacterium]
MSRRWGLLVLLTALAAAAGLFLGAEPLPAGAVWRGLVDPAAPGALIVRDLRLPRVLLGFVIGGSLAVSGASLQALLRNPLADPYLLGLSGGAGLGAVGAIALRLPVAWAVPAAAFAGALAALGLVYALGRSASGRLDPRVLLLAGVVTSSFAAAVMSALMVLSDAAELRNAFLWLLGGLGRAAWGPLGLFLLWAPLPLAVLFLSSRSLDLLALGEETAGYLGAEVERVKRRVVLSAALLTAAAVAVCGMIGFVGLVVPHLVRRLLGPLHARLLPVSFVLGGALLVGADALARVVARPVELPVGVVTALVGVPVFAFLLRREAGR